MKTLAKIFISTFYFSLLLSLNAQVNFEPVNKSVYSFLERMSNKGAIQLNEEILPFSRIYISEKIIELDKIKSKLSKLEKDDLEFYIKEYSAELKKLNFDLQNFEAKNKLIDLKTDNFGFDKYNRFRLFSYDSDNFGIFADPIFRFNYASGDENSSLWSNGLRLYGILGSSFGFELQFYDNHASGDFYNSDRKYSKLTGYEFDVGKNDGLDFDRMNANITYSWNSGSFTIGKDFNYYGSGENGKLLLSNKAPSFPNLKLEVYPTKWLRFSYMHGVLNSQIIDSTTIRLNPQRDHFSTVEKYFVTHLLSITPFKSLNFSVGESVIYSDKFQPIYLIPIAFFRLADHYLTDPDENAGNAQIFASFWYKNYKLRTKIYGSVFIDELSLGTPENPEATAYNIGFKTIDPLIPESELTVEYTKVLPFVYFHSDPAQTYESYGYQLGHWIGSNADQIYTSFTKRIIRGLNFKIEYSYTRKGEEENFEEARYQDKHSFLWGKNTLYSDYGAILNYEIFHDLFVTISYNKFDISTEQEDNSFVESSNSFFSFSVGYGF
ncbi:MAG: capsule assembly Wzi family protein [Ignavibacteriae bacterium]|nr:capsule assembly Wzi family protein [Ignavibacteriota bacterium]